MRAALIPPIEALSLVESTDFHLTLAHMYSDVRYAAFYDNAQGHIILDNSAYEMPEALPISSLQQLATHHRISEMVLPDKLLDGSRTFALTANAIHELSTTTTAYHRNQSSGHRVQYMVCPQGADMLEWQWCFQRIWWEWKTFFSRWELPVFAISKVYDDESRILGGRAKLAHIIREALPEAEIHLFGFTTWEKLTNATEFNIRSVDTAYPFVAALHGQDVTCTKRLRRPEGYFTRKIDNKMYEQMMINVAEFLRIADHI